MIRMKHFKVDADFYLDNEVDRQTLADSLVREFSNVTFDQIHEIRVTMETSDSIDVQFIVESETYEVATRIAQNYLATLEEQVNDWFRLNSSNSKIEDESLLLMPA